MPGSGEAAGVENVWIIMHNGLALWHRSQKNLPDCRGPEYFGTYVEISRPKQY
jgi:hypothetical protein